MDPSTIVPHSANRLDTWEQRLGALSGAVPYLLLAASTIFAGLEANQSWVEQLGTLGLAALTAAWMAWMVTLHPAWAEHRTRMSVYCAGLLLLIGLLITRSPWFGIFAFTGYLHTWHYLRGAWRLVGVTVTAVLSATWQAGGFPPLTAPAIFTYLISIVVIVMLVALFSSLGEVTHEQSKQRKRVIDELAEANRKLEETLRENAGLHAQVLAQAREAGILDERQRMAREIHDTLAQDLTGIITQLEAAEQAGRHPDQWRRHLDQARALARESLTAARRSVQALRPEPLDAVPLPDAIAGMARRWSESSAVALHFEITGVPQPLVAEIEDALFRAAQEALTNVAKHARATRVGVTLSYTEDVVLLDVRDDGIGFAVASRSDGETEGQRFGLRAMEQRLRRVAGTLEIESAPGQGTAISACVPAIREASQA